MFKRERYFQKGLKANSNPFSTVFAPSFFEIGTNSEKNLGCSPSYNIK